MAAVAATSACFKEVFDAGVKHLGIDSTKIQDELLLVLKHTFRKIFRRMTIDA